MSRYLFFSDLHLAADDKVDNFTGYKRFFDFIKWKDKQNITKTYVLGDVYELWQSEKFINEKERCAAIEKRYKDVLDILKKYTWIAGNHDHFLVKQYNLPEEMVIEDSSGYKIGILHGHQFDEECKDGSWVGKAVTEVWGKLEVIFGVFRMSKIQDYFYNLKIKGKKSATEIEDTKYIAKSIVYAQQKGWNVIVIGHTHRQKMTPSVLVKEGITYINSGCAVGGSFNYAIIDTDKNNVELGNFIK